MFLFENASLDMLFAILDCSFFFRPCCLACPHCGLAHLSDWVLLLVFSVRDPNYVLRHPLLEIYMYTFRNCRPFRAIIIARLINECAQILDYFHFLWNIQRIA